ncbi:MAG: hypothetical protein LBU16_09400 [Treponema sp.]|jgi:hypothetical protein|nr:hypothetical protein [Treponema sp.]
MKKTWKRAAASLVVVLLLAAGCASGPGSGGDQGRVRVIRSQQDMDALIGLRGGSWGQDGAVAFLNKDVRKWLAADTGLPFDGVVVAGGAKVKLYLPGELIPRQPGMTAADAHTFYIPAGKFLKVQSGAALQLWSGMAADDFDNTTLVVGGVGTSNPEVSVAPAGGNVKTAASVLNKDYPYAIEIEEGGLFILGSDSPSATDKTGGTGAPDNATLWLADGKSLDANGKPSPYAGFIKIDGELRVSCAAGAGVAKIWTIENLTGNGSTLAGKGKLSIYGLHPVKGTALFAINEFDRGELSNGMDWLDVPSIALGTIEIVGEGVEGIYNPDGSVDGSPGYRNNANAGFYYVAGTGTINVGKMIVKSNHPNVTADTTVALANFNTAAGILGGTVTDQGPVVELGEVEIYNAAVNDADGPLSAIYTVQGVITATVTGTVKVEAPGGGAAAIVSTGHGRWTGPEKTTSRIGSVLASAAGKNAFFQNNTFDGYGAFITGDVVVRAVHDGSLASFVGRVPPGPDMGKGGVKGSAPEAEDARDEQFVNQGGEVRIGGKVSVENKGGITLINVERGAKTSVGSLVVNGTAVEPAANLSSSGGSGPVRIVNNGTFSVAGK